MTRSTLVSRVQSGMAAVLLLGALLAAPPVFADPTPSQNLRECFADSAEAYEECKISNPGFIDAVTCTGLYAGDLVACWAAYVEEFEALGGLTGGEG